MKRKTLAVLVLFISACARSEEGESPDTLTTLSQPAEATVADTSSPKSPADNSGGGAASAAPSPRPRANPSKVPALPPPDSTAKTANPRPGMRPQARDREPWQVPPDSGDTTRPRDTPPD